MSTQLTPFSFESHSIRVVQIDGDPWFVGKDICEALGYAHPNSALKKVPDKWKRHSVCMTNGGTQLPTVLSKPGVVCLISRSRQPKASDLQLSLFSSMVNITDILNALSSFEVPDDLPDMFVYAIREKATGNIKIGISRDPEQRLRNLQTGNSSELELVAFRKAENRFSDERALHVQAGLYHLRGEWFDARSIKVLQ